MQSAMIYATSTASVDDFLVLTSASYFSCLKIDFDYVSQLTELEEVAAVVKKLPYLNAADAFRSVLRPALVGREVDVLAIIDSKLPPVSVDFVKKGSAEKVEAGDVDEDEVDEDVGDVVAAHRDLFFYEQEPSQAMSSTVSLSTTPISWVGSSIVSPATPIKEKTASITTTTSAPLKWIGNSNVSPATPVKKTHIPKLWSATTATPPRTRRNKENIKPQGGSDDVKAIKRARRVTPPSLLQAMLKNDSARF
ncbi:hypothetical protein VNI00_008500 [Paramarasmius palmivorus]|uniref:Uncharacterized protein n=1 Tax=Paramarasmius palmivorus TaxID=297713 RepID=A0AAW0CTE6_9AGAR